MRCSILLFVWALATLGGQPVLASAPCTTAPDTCTEWITLKGGPARALVYRSHSLEQRNERITRMLVMVHGKKIGRAHV